MKPRPRRRAPARAPASCDLAVRAAALASAGLLAFVAWYVHAERWIYYWDQSGHWLATIDVAERLRHGILATLATVARTVRRDDYNLAIVLPLAPVTLLLGASRPVYVLSVAALYGVSAAASIAYFARRAFLAPLRVSSAALAAGVVTAFVCARFWLPVLVGLPDVAGCIVIPFVWWLLRVPLERLEPRRIATAASLLVLLVILRRWYAYWVVALFVALALEGALRVRDRSALVAAGARLAALGALVLALLLLATGAHGLAMLRTDYARIYAAYRAADPLRAAAVHLLRDFGPTWLALAAGGAAVALRAGATRPWARLLLWQSIVIVLLFARTQTFNAHHYYLLIPQIACFASVAVATVAGLRPALVRRALCAALGVVLLLDFAVVLVPGVQQRLGSLAAAFSGVAHPPLVRRDLDEIARLVRSLDALTRDGGKVYVLSSSVLLNEEVLANARRSDPTLPDLRDRILRTSHVDQRDDFPWSIALARWVVLTDPVGYHLDPANQRVVGIPAREIAAGTTIGRWFERQTEAFVLEDGSRVTIHRRTGEIPRADLELLRGELSGAHFGR